MDRALAARKGAQTTLVRREFRVRPRALAVNLALLLIFTILPIMSIHELYTTGTIDWMASGSGRRRYPSWFVYPFGWALLLYFLRLYLPLYKYLWQPLMFALDDEAIEIDGHRIPLDQVIALHPRSHRADVLVETEQGDFSIRPYQVARGVSALRKAFPDRFEPQYLTDAPAWVVGD